LDLADLARNALDDTETEATSRHVAVETALAPTLVAGDPVLLEQAIRNLVDNAIRCNMPGGSLTVRTTVSPLGASEYVGNIGSTIAPP
jgi:signal transduction histidine kinase